MKLTVTLAIATLLSFSSKAQLTEGYFQYSIDVSSLDTSAEMQQQVSTLLTLMV